MTKIKRYDLATLGEAEVTSQGFLRAPATFSRAGVFLYRMGDGTIRREYRPPEEVFAKDSLASFEDAPVTAGHPDEMVTSENCRYLGVGMVKDRPVRDGKKMSGRILITNADAIAGVMSKQRASLSCGYTADFDATPGVSPDGEAYDGVQRNIRGNHVALVEVGRAGPDARVKLDASDGIEVPETHPGNDPQKPKGDNVQLKTIRIDGIDVQVLDTHAQIVERAAAKQDAAVADAQKQITELQKKLDDANKAKSVAEAKADTAEAELKKRGDKSEVQKLVRERTELLGQAVSVLGEEKADELKLDTLDDLEIKRHVILAAHPEAKLDGKDAAYVAARFDGVIEWLGSGGALGDARRAAHDPAPRQDGEIDIDKIRADAAKKSAEKYKATKEAQS